MPSRRGRTNGRITVKYDEPYEELSDQDMENCPTCGNPLNGEDPRFCYFCEKPVAPIQQKGNLTVAQGTEPSESSHNMLNKCPSCGKLFAGELIKKEPVDFNVSHQKLQNECDPRRMADIGISDTTLESEAFRYYYRCKHCSFEWNREKIETHKL